jgi:hypothetical protein
MELEKLCFSCNTTKPYSEFNKQQRAKDALQFRCKSCFSMYRLSIKDRMREYSAVYRENNKEYLVKKKAEYREKNKEVLSIRNKAYNSKESTLKRRSEYHKNRMKTDINYRIGFNLKRYFKSSIDAQIKNSKNLNTCVKNIRNLDYTANDLRVHIESLFKDGMSWDNYGYWTWHIDHIKPLCLFDLTDEKQLKEAWSLKNLQPLWAKENLQKNKKYKL